MSEPSIIMIGESVRAILDGRKTQTRRVIKPQPNYMKRQGESDRSMIANIARRKCPYGVVGDRLWVRENWWDLGFWKNKQWHGRGPSHTIGPKYVADGKPEGPIAKDKRPSLICTWRKRPSIHIPKWACRLWLEITGIRVERVQEISFIDVFDEGCPLCQDEENYADEAKEWFINLWDSINAKQGYSFESNPYMWVIEFRKVKDGE